MNGIVKGCVNKNEKTRLEEVEELIREAYDELKVFVWDEKEDEFRNVLKRWGDLIVEKSSLDGNK